MAIQYFKDLTVIVAYITYCFVSEPFPSSLIKFIEAFGVVDQHQALEKDLRKDTVVLGHSFN